MNKHVAPRRDDAAMVYTKTCLEPLPMGVSYTVKRERMVRDLVQRGQDAGIVVMCAPKGFGKTAALLQYADEVRSDPTRGVVQMIEAEGADPGELLVQLDEIEAETLGAERPLVVIDNLPSYAERETDAIVARFRELRSGGYELAISCTPSNAGFMRSLGDSSKVGAQALRVHPREYSAWARTFMISKTLDVYGLTQGIPELVAALQAGTGAVSCDEDLLQAAVLDVTGSVLAELVRSKSPALRLACLMLLVGDGNVAEFERCGVRASSESLSKIVHDYPVFGFEPTTGAFSCLGSEENARRRIREVVVSLYPDLAARAVRVHMKAGRTDLGVRLAESFTSTTQALELVSQFPVQIALSGHAGFVSGVMNDRKNAKARETMSVAVALSVYLSALTVGDYRLARTMRRILCEHACDIESEISARDWSSALAASHTWGSLNGLELPLMSAGFVKQESEQAAELSMHCSALSNLIEGVFDAEPVAIDLVALEDSTEVDIPQLLLLVDFMLQELVAGDFAAPDEKDALLQALLQRLRKQKLTPILDYARMALAARRLMACMPVVDERAFSEATTGAIRASEQGLQLFCTLFEGWQELDMGQVINAQFRGQQIRKLAHPHQEFLLEWAYLLETTAHLRNTSLVSIREEAEVLDLMEPDVSPAKAWGYALQLSAAHFDAELSAWFSLHKDALLAPRARLFARLAMRAMGERADPVRRLIPQRLARGYASGLASDHDETRLFEVMAPDPDPEMGQVVITLFGGLKISRNGHTLTGDVWRRKRATVLAARLVLGMGSMVGRKTLTEEMWPELPYTRARENLYVTLSTLRRAIGQTSGGPEYIIAQGEGISINNDYVSSDVSRFDALAREVLLRKSGTSSAQIIEMCLKMDELYTGELFVPNSGDASFFIHMKKTLGAKFIDCMIKGAELAVEENDLASAAWLIESARRHEPRREDVIRCAMTVYDATGRRNEVVDMYRSHLRYLEEELHAIPEAETREAYDRIIGHARIRGVL